MLVDLDHLADYYLNGGMGFDIRKIYTACEARVFDRLYLALHSYELLFFLWLAVYLFRLSPLWISAATGLTLHLILDQFTNPIRMKGYFLFYRIFKGFDSKYIMLEDSN